MPGGGWRWNISLAYCKVNLGFKFHWIWVQIPTAILKHFRGPEKPNKSWFLSWSPFVGKQCTLPSSGPFLRSNHRHIPPNTPLQKAPVMDLTLHCLWYVFKKPGFHKQLRSSLYFRTIYGLIFLQKVHILLPLAAWHGKTHTLLLSVGLLITRSEEHFLNNKREGGCHWHL